MSNQQLAKSEAYTYIEVQGHQIPLRPYYGWRFVELLPFEQLFDKYYDHHRLEVFAKKGLACVHPDCDKVATHLIVTVDPTGNRHTDVVDANFRLMNVDHIVPKSRNGLDILENKQPMCVYHNSRKSNKLVPY